MTDRSRIWVKICANTSLEDARGAAEAGANAVGFVFAPSPRRVTVEQVASIVPHLPMELEKIGVFVDATAEQISAAARACGLTGVQLHSGVYTDVAAELRERLGANIRIVRVLHFENGAEEQAGAMAADRNTDAVLVDSRTATAMGGTGLTFDWKRARESLFGHGHTTKFIVAGGLTPDNVAEAIATLRPWGVDVASGVEAAPGRKDPAKVREFIAAARRAG